jgi:hypothetical protein
MVEAMLVLFDLFLMDNVHWSFLEGWVYFTLYGVVHKRIVCAHLLPAVHIKERYIGAKMRVF